MGTVADTSAGQTNASYRARRWPGPDSSGYLLIAPAYAIYVVWVLVPMFLVVAISLTNFSFSGQWQWVGLSNYREMLNSETFAIALRNTVVYAVFTILPSLILGLLLAVALNRKIIGTSVFRQVYYYPNVVSFVAASVIWLWIYDPTNGLANRALEAVGLPSLEWLHDPGLAMPALIVVGIWKGLGFNMVVYLAALQGVPREIYESARVDGAREVDCLFRITIPLIQPTTFFLLITGLIRGFEAFDLIFVMTGGGPANATTTLVHQAYLNAFFYQRFGLGAAISVFLLAVVATVTLSNFRYGRQGQTTEVN